MFKINDRVKIVGKHYNGEFGTITAEPSQSNIYYTVNLDMGVVNFFPAIEMVVIGHDPIDNSKYVIWTPPEEISVKTCTCGMWITYGKDCDNDFHKNYCDLIRKD